MDIKTNEQLQANALLDSSKHSYIENVPAYFSNLVYNSTDRKSVV